MLVRRPIRPADPAWFRARPMVSSRRLVSALKQGFRVDETHNSDRGWTYNLAIFRIVFLGVVVLPFARRMVWWTESAMPLLPRDVWVPLSFYRYLPFDVLVDARIAHSLAVANVVLVALALLGVCTRWTLGLATLVSLYVFGLLENQGKVDHFHHVVWLMAVLAAGPSGRLLSVDSIWAAIRNADAGRVEPPIPERAALTALRYCWILIGLAYFFPGMSKLHAAIARGWAGADNLRALLWHQWFELQLYQPDFRLPPRVDELPSLLLSLAGAGAILFEVGFVAFVLFRRIRPVLAVAGLAFHVGNGYFLNIFFVHLMWAYVCLIDWTGLGRAVSSRLVGRPPLVVLYDGGCHLCRRTLALLRSIDLFDQLEPVDGLSGDPRRKRFPDLTDAMLAHDLYAGDGRRTAGGYEAYQWIASRLPILWWAGLIMRWGPVSAVGKRIYRRVADSRACSIEDRPVRPAIGTRAGTRPLSWVGALLIAGEIGISSLQLGYDVSRVHLGDRHVIPQLLARVSWRFTGWPFDQYPTFSTVYEPRVTLWEAKAMLADGREIPLDAGAYWRVFGTSTRSWVALQALLKEKDPERHRARSLELIRSVWPFQPAGVRQAAVAVRVYHSAYSTRPGAGATDETLVDTFPIRMVTP